MRLSTSTIGSYLQPQYLFAWENVDDDAAIRRKKDDTAWLDGVRGISAFQVFIFHFTSGYTPMQNSYGSTPRDHHLHQLPIFRPLWFGGASAICVFFVVSGYALTTSSFALIRQHQHDLLYRRLCSAIFRRWFRLWPPVIAIAFCMVFFFQYWPYVGMYSPPARSSLLTEIAEFVYYILDASRPLAFVDRRGIPFYLPYVPQAWTIPVEFYCSIVCYVLVMLLSPITSFKRRALIMGFLALYCMHDGIWWMSNFLVGMLLADLDLEKPVAPSTMTEADLLEYWKVGWDGKGFGISRENFLTGLTFFVGYYLSGTPQQEVWIKPYVPKVGYDFLYSMYLPKWLVDIDMPLRYYQSISATLLMIAISRSPYLRRIFASKICRWFGKLSFGVYLSHVQVLGIFSGPLRLVSGLLVTSWKYPLFMYCFEMILTLPVTFIVAAMVWRYIDEPSIRFSKWLEKQVIGSTMQAATHPGHIPDHGQNGNVIEMQ